jgi:uncharacterized membrane protein YeaQ/YmgE (transglycosylase-associated protein family)
MGLGGLEILVICGLIGGVVGYFLRTKSNKNGALIGVLLGVSGALFMTWLLVTILVASYLLMPVYAIFGSWLANFLFKKVASNL